MKLAIQETKKCGKPQSFLKVKWKEDQFLIVSDY